MRLLFLIFCLVSFQAFSQSNTYIIGVKGDTLNRVDKKGLKQGKWVNHVDEIREEPGYEEEGVYVDGRKEGGWRIYNLSGDLIGLENYRWGNKDGLCQYFNPSGALVREEGWRAMNPDKQYDTLEIEDIDHLDTYHTVIVKNEGVAIKHGQWKYYDPSTGFIVRTQTYTLGKLENAKSGSSASKDTSATATKSLVKPKEVQDYEKKNAGKKKIRVRDGTVGY
ncbi:MAG: hypothetical protein C5B59_15120 [Bacteroidetes bacterium]|nr:MAG: hypothetical protein C5B59_15120 [Bacteroidota bacterium]